MKHTILITITTLFLNIMNFNAQNQNELLKANNSVGLQIKSETDVEESAIKYPKTKKRIIAGIKVLNRHGAKFYYDKKEITYRESLKLVRKEFPNLLVKEDRNKEEIHFTTNNLKRK